MGGSKGEGRKERRMVFLLFGLVENELSERNERDHIRSEELCFWLKMHSRKRNCLGKVKGTRRRGKKLVFPSFGWLKMHDKVGFLSDKDLFSFGKVGAGGEK